MTTANYITLLRLALLPVFLFLVLGYAPEHPGWRHAALVLYGVSAASDIADGLVARRFHQISRLGKRLDPLADKLLVNLGFVFVASNRFFDPGIPLWAPPLFLFRDIYIVLGAYYINEKYGPFIVKPRCSGKATTVMQMAAMIGVLSAHVLAPALLMGAVLASIWSSVDYFFAGYRQVKQKQKIS